MPLFGLRALCVVEALPSDCETFPRPNLKGKGLPAALLSLIGFWAKWQRITCDQHLESVTLSDSCRIHVCTQEITSLPYTWIPEWI